ncbi:MAG: endonuclease/exonuclease/phosphatase family protein, partial [Planctomycetota bacterium]
MRTLTLFTLWMLSLGCSGTGAPIPAPEEGSRPPIAADAPLRIKVLSYNIHHGRGADGRIDLPRIAAVIERSGAD